MPRVKMLPEERRAGLVAAARKVFSAKGITNTRVSDIVEAARVAQGTFYLYFDSKDEVVNAVIEDMADEIYHTIITISASAELSALEKIMQMRYLLFANLNRNKELLEYYHHEGNSQVHDQLVREMTKRLLPAICRIIKQGIEEGVFDTPYPEEAAAFVIATSEAIPEDSIARGQESGSRWEKALSDFVLKALGYKGPFPEELVYDSQEG